MDGRYQFNKRFNHTYDIFYCILYYSDNTWFHYIIYGYMGLFDIYNKQDRRIIMAKEKEDRLKKVLEDMSYSLNHIEDIMADDRELLVKLVKQNNTIVQYLKGLEIEMVDEYGEPITKEEEQRIKKSEELKEVLDEFMAKRKDLKEFEKELKKNKDMLTPGQVGES
jgi:CRISPR/Cas system CSM-associated protein Csm2 small subunit